MATKITKISDADGNTILPFYGLLTAGVADIPDGADLNNYKTIGVYSHDSDAGMPTIVNKPTDLRHSFKLFVVNVLTNTASVGSGNYQYFLQIIISYIGGIYIRRVFSGNTATNISYGSWMKVTMTTVS